MNSATLIGFDSDGWLTLARWLALPGLSYVILYLLRVEVRKLPLIPLEHEFRLPSWVAGGIAGVMTFLLSLSSVAYFALGHVTRLANEEQFLSTFFRALTPPEREWLERVAAHDVREGFIRVLDYDGFSDLIILVNNWRLFGTHVDCAGKQQCQRPGAEPPAPPPFRLDSRFANVLRPNVLGESRPMLHLRSGKNRIDILSENSGVGACRSTVEVGFRTANGETIARQFRIADGQEHAIKTYQTRRENGSYRVCDRIRLEPELRYP